MRRHAEQRNAWSAFSLSAPAMFWLLVFFVLPLLIVLGISFFTNGTYGELERPLTLESYQRFLGFSTFGWEPVYPLIIARSLLLAFVTMLLCALIGLPVAFWIAGMSARWKTAALIFVVVPLWTNLLVRTYAWQLLLGPETWLARTLNNGAALYPGTLAVLVGLVCDYLPFLVLPLYASVEKIDWTLAEAARDLGATPRGVFRHAVLPQVLPGLGAGLLLVFVPATGQFVVPDLLGGGKTVLLGNAIQQQFGASRDWPFGSALAMIAMLVVLAGLWFNARLARRTGEAL
jgi:spermidine/putrescine transport system permease protein